MNKIDRDRKKSRKTINKNKKLELEKQTMSARGEKGSLNSKMVYKTTQLEKMYGVFKDPRKSLDDWRQQKSGYKRPIFRNKKVD